ncbi:MAG: FAD-binding oxidoreductase [Crocinitomicaceae bacterium]
MATREKKKGWVEILLTKYRGTFATLILIPISVCFESYLKSKRKISFWLRSAPKKHDKRVQKVRNQLKDWKENGCQEQLTTGRSGWFSMSELVPAYKKTNRKIHLNMNDILEINEEKQTVRVEPQVSMGQLTSALNPRGWTIAVLPELDDLTVGGLVNGFGIETSSHKYGLFQYICESFEIITPDGELKKCSKDENSDLFAMIPWSYGTLGFLVAVELKMLPAKKYVRLQYIPIESQEQLIKKFEEESRKKEPHDFVEGIVFDKDRSVLLIGDMVDKKGDDGKRNPIRRWYKPWFYTHVEKILNSAKDTVEYIPLRQYYHRHTRSLFWMMDHVIPFGNHPLHRFLFGWAMPPQLSLMKYFETETTRRLREKHSVTQDMLVPIEKLKASLDHFHEYFNLYPLWLCPMAIYDHENELGMIHPYKKPDGSKDEMFVDIGAYGIGNIEEFDGNEALKKCEKFVVENDGYQALYAKTFLSREDFRKMFDHSYYDKLRNKISLAQEAFPNVYDKLSSKSRIAPSEYKKLKVKKTN